MADLRPHHLALVFCLSSALACSTASKPKPGATGAAGTITGAAGESAGAAGQSSGAAGDPSGAAGAATGAAGDQPATGTGGSVNDGGLTGAAGQAADQDSGSAYPIGDPGTTGDGDFMIAPPYGTQPDLKDNGNPKGKSFHFVMSSADSKLFKGDDPTLMAANMHTFMRGVDVYVPAQYKDGTPAPVLVIQDGPGELSIVKNALDNLTISKDPARKVPAFVVVAIANGGGDGRGSERGLEYDTMSGKYADFVETEVFPAVLANAQVKAAYPNLSFTPNPEGRATLGCSSGGAAAMSMGWFRPNLFHRIITYSATLVAQQNATAPEAMSFPDGAWDYHSNLMLVQNNPRKDLRVFLNCNQMDNGATNTDASMHNWITANMRMDAALNAKGYHDRFVYAAGVGHCDYNVQTQTLADTLVWMWRGYPPP